MFLLLNVVIFKKKTTVRLAMLDQKTRETLREAFMKRIGIIVVLISFGLFCFLVPYCSTSEYCILQERNCSGLQHVACGIQVSFRLFNS